MKKTLTQFCSLVFAGMLSLQAQAETIRLANGEWPPYMSENFKEAGVVSHIVKEAFAQEGITVEYTFLPWKRGYEDAKNNKLHGTIVWSYTDERAADFDYSDPVVDVRTLFFITKDSKFDWTDKNSLAGKKIGGVIGYNYALDEQEAAGIVEIIRIANPEANFKKLVDKRVDAVAESEEVGWELINQLGYENQITTHPQPIKANPYHLLLNKKNPDNKRLMEAFNRGLKKLRENGTYDAYFGASRRGDYKR